MLKRVKGYLTTRDPETAPEASHHLERDGYVVLRSIFTSAEIDELRKEIDRVFETLPRDNRADERRAPDEDEMFRYEMYNRSEACQRAIGHPDILSVIEPLLGEDCHVIANTAWRNLAHHEGTHGGQAWHIDAGPHVPLPDGVTWPSNIPHPVFAIGTHIYLKDCGLEDGPTGVIPGSHLSGRFPPLEQLMDPDLEYNGRGAAPLLTSAGDVGLFVSDVWHRRMPAGEHDSGRYFLQAHYGRRDIAQRVKSTDEVNHVAPDAEARATSTRERTLIGLHPNFFYDG